MGIKEDIFGEFFTALKAEKEIPELTVGELEQLIKSKEGISEEKILDSILRGCENGGEVKED